MPTNHETIFLYCFQYSIAIPAGDGIAIGCIRHIITMAEIVSTSLTISAIFVCRVPWLVMKQLKISLPFSRSLVARTKGRL